MGERDLTIYAQTRNLKNPQRLPIHIQGRAVAPKEDPLVAFARADQAIISAYNYHEAEEGAYPSDHGLARLCMPVCRVNPGLPSQVILHVARFEPVITALDITSYVARPPAVPEVLPAKGRKWYTNRQTMSMERKGTGLTTLQEATGGASATVPAHMARRLEADSFLGPMDRKVVFERPKRR